MFPLDWIVRSILVACAVGLTIYGAIRHTGHPALKAAGAFIVIALFVGLSWHPIWEDFHRQFPTVALGWLNGPQKLPRPQPAPILQSRAGKMMLACAQPPGDKRAFDEWKLTFKNASQIYGVATGLIVSLADVPKGIKIEMTAKTAEGRARMGAVTKVTIQAQRLTDQNILVIYSWEIPGVFGEFLASMPLDVNAEQTNQAIKLVEKLFGPTADKCTII